MLHFKLFSCLHPTQVVVKVLHDILFKKSITLVYAKEDTVCAQTDLLDFKKVGDCLGFAHAAREQ